ncbi:MAG: DUF6855 family protein [Paracoccaceae bacterium]
MEGRRKRPPALVVQVGKMRLSYQLRAMDDVYEMLMSHGDWMRIGNADEGKPTKPGTSEDWARSEKSQKISKVSEGKHHFEGVIKTVIRYPRPAFQRHDN